MHIHLIGLQETRLPRSSGFANGFWMISGGHDKHNLGCSLLVNLDIPYINSSCQRRYLAPRHFKILHQHPRLLIVRLSAPGLHRTLAIAHAPHSDSTDEKCDNFWVLLNNATDKFAVDLLLIDANGTTGEIVSQHIEAATSIGI